MNQTRFQILGFVTSTTNLVFQNILKEFYGNDKNMSGLQLGNKWISFHERNHFSLLNFFIHIDALVAEYKFKFGVVRKNYYLLVGLKFNGAIYTHFIKNTFFYENLEQFGIVSNVN